MDIRITLQINLNKCRAANDLMMLATKELCVDIVIINEPFVIKDYWFADTDRLAAIWVTPRRMEKEIPIKMIGNGRGYVAIKIGSDMIIGCYFPPRMSRQDFENALDEIMNMIEENRKLEVILAGDLNAKYPAWCSRKWDLRGSMVMEFCGRAKVTPASSSGDITFERNERSSLIDIVMCSKARFKDFPCQEPPRCRDAGA